MTSKKKTTTRISPRAAQLLRDMPRNRIDSGACVIQQGCACFTGNTPAPSRRYSQHPARQPDRPETPTASPQCTGVGGLPHAPALDTRKIRGVEVRGAAQHDHGEVDIGAVRIAAILRHDQVATVRHVHRMNAKITAFDRLEAARRVQGIRGARMMRKRETIPPQSAAKSGGGYNGSACTYSSLPRM